jgi:hypothetical protein
MTDDIMKAGLSSFLQTPAYQSSPLAYRSLRMSRALGELLKDLPDPPFELWISHFMRKINPTMIRTQKTSMKIPPNQPMPHPPIAPGPICQPPYPAHWANASRAGLKKKKEKPAVNPKREKFWDFIASSLSFPVFHSHVMPAPTGASLKI